MQGEHGTGRNVAPFVEMEWGTKAYDLMWELKQLFDPTFVLNPGVVLNRVSLVPCLVRQSDLYRQHHGSRYTDHCQYVHSVFDGFAC